MPRTRTTNGPRCAVLLGVVWLFALAAASATAQEESVTVTGIGGIFFKAEDPDALRAWYREKLGFPSGEESYHLFRWRPVDDPTRVASTTFGIFPAGTTYFDPGRAPFMLNLRVSDLDATLRSLRDAGVWVDDRVQDEEYGRFGWIMDPEGNRIELWEPPEDLERVVPDRAEADVRAAVDAMVRAQLDGDTAVLGRLIADSFRGWDVRSGAFTRRDILDGYGPGGVSLDRHEMMELEIRVHGPTAVTTGAAVIAGRTGEGPFESRIHFMDVWTRTPRGWALTAAHVAEWP